MLTKAAAVFDNMPYTLQAVIFVCVKIKIFGMLSGLGDFNMCVIPERSFCMLKGNTLKS